MAKLLKFLRLIALLIIPSASLLYAQGSPTQPYLCPQQSEVKSETPFTQEAVEALLGFSDPSLGDVVNIPMYTAFTPKPIYFFYLSCTPQNDATFVAVLYFAPLYKSHLLIFHLQGNVVAGRARLDMTTVLAPELVHLSGFADRNFNGLPDVVVSGSDGGNGGFSEMRIVELGKDGSLQDITPVGRDADSAGFFDIDGNGISEIYVTERFFVPTFSSPGAAIQYIDQFWAWNSLGVQLIAVQVQAFSTKSYPPENETEIDSGDQIESYLSGLSDAQICADVGNETEQDQGELRWKLFQILMYYHAWDDLRAGWTRIHPILLAADQCADSDGKRVFFGALGAFEAYFTHS